MIWGVYGPSLMGVSLKSPLGHQAVHQHTEPVVVMPFGQVDPLMHLHILKAHGYPGQGFLQESPHAR